MRHVLSGKPAAGMPFTETHPYPSADAFDGGELDCGNGLLLLIRKHIDPLDPGQLLEILSLESSVEEDLPAWCRLTGNELVNMAKDGARRSFLVSKGPFSPPSPTVAPEDPDTGGTVTVPGVVIGQGGRRQAPITQPVVVPTIPSALPQPLPAPVIDPLSIMGVGSWPRPRWLRRALHEHLESRMSDAEFEETADDAVRLAVEAQVRAGADVLTDGEQRRDNYASFVGGLLENCQLIPVTDLLPYVDDPEEFERELAALDVPAGQVRHPAVFGPLGRGRSLTVHEADFVRRLSDKPVKVSLPGPYLLTRTMWMECISDRAYPDREALATDIVRVLREEAHFLLAAGVALVQFDEPVLTEVVYGTPGEGGRTFMCGALGERRGTEEELAFARDLLQEVVRGMPSERLALHVCRGNWTPDERMALAGDYRPLVGLLSAVDVGTLTLELCTRRAGEIDVLATIPDDRRVGVGVVNQKDQRVDEVADVVARAEQAITLFGAERVLLNPDCGFATFADNPIVTAEVAEAKLAVLAQARDLLRERHRL
ncbi:MAG: 5-methyltetrahydropteroyltriglutamate--homocysteine methyltransferase [Actinomycetota bacterium]|nr:5-methyltetrahydropteroyltriglutamate--homocysteine methyltransferase [Actinomycetota bacterium]